MKNFTLIKRLGTRIIRHSLLLFFLSPLFVSAQVLTPDEALRIGLKSNFDVLVAKNEAEADSIFNSPGEAGMLPNISLNAGATINRNNIHQQYANGSDIRSNNAGGTNLNAGVALSWTLFDGTKMFVTKNKLEQIQMLGEFLFREQVLNTTSDILLAYYDIVRQKQQLAATDTVIKYNNERVKITEARFNAGLGPKTDLLQAKIDLNVLKENRINLEYALGEAKRKMNTILARDVNMQFDVVDSIPLTPLTDRSQMEQKMYAANPTLMAFKSQVEISKLAYRETKTQYFPKIALNAGYNFAQNQNTAGFSLYNQAYGWNTGLTFTMPLYQGGRLNHQVAVAQLNIESSEFRFQQASIEASLALQDALTQYDSRTQSLELEQQNESMARENMQLALARLRLGEGTALEVAEAQATLASTLLRLAGFRYDVKAAEIGVHVQASDL